MKYHLISGACGFVGKNFVKHLLKNTDDIIIAIDGFTIREMADLISYLGENVSPDDLVTLTIIRDTTELELSVKIGKRPS